MRGDINFHLLFSRLTFEVWFSESPKVRQHASDLSHAPKNEVKMLNDTEKLSCHLGSSFLGVGDLLMPVDICTNVDAIPKISGVRQQLR